MELRPTSERRIAETGADRSPEGLVHCTKKKIAIIVCVVLSVAAIAAVIGAVSAILFGGTDDDHTIPSVSTTQHLPSLVTNVVYPSPSPTTSICQTITDNSLLTFKGILNLTLVTSEIKEVSQVFDLNAIVADKPYLLVMAQNELYVYLMNDDDTLDKLQNISARGDLSYLEMVFFSEYFVFDGTHYVIISSLDSGTNYYNDVYSWDGTKLTVDGIVNLVISAYGNKYSAGWSFIESASQGEAFLANAFGSEWDGVQTENTVIYLFNGTHFNDFQDIYTGMNTKKVSFFQTDDDDIYLAMGSTYSPDTPTSFVYKYNPSSSKFEQHQSFPMKGFTSDIVIFDIEDETYLMHTLFKSADSTDGAASPLYLWNTVSSEFELHQTFNTTNGQAACHIEYCNQHYLIVVSHESDVVMYKWDGEYFVEFSVLYKYAGTPLHACHVFYANGTPYLAVDKLVYIVVQV
ncbi:uncharacterized protein [Ptychodera flava]|uniref:uncharacterized protein n=1 Tax=Ptychodera flava TaxID=63121 RepID=UPI00396A3D3A